MDVLEGELAGGDGPAAVFIDRSVFGGFHGGGFAAGGIGRLPRCGLARRLRRCGGVGAVGAWQRPYVARGAWCRGGYGGAAAGATAVGALRSALRQRTYPYYGGTCGYYPYPLVIEVSPTPLRAELTA